MDSSYCCLVAKDKLDYAFNAPIEYVLNDVVNFFKLAFSSNWYHSVPTIVFIVSVSLAIQNHVENLFLHAQHSDALKKRPYKYMMAVMKGCVLFFPLVILFSGWVFIQELVYCVAWFLTSEGLNPDLLNKWWFKRSNETSEASENIRSFIEVVPPEILSWIIMTLTASFILVISVNGTTEPVKKTGLNCLFRNDLHPTFNKGEHTFNPLNNYVGNNRREEEDYSDSEVDIDSARTQEISPPSPVRQEDDESETVQIAKLLKMGLGQEDGLTGNTYISDMNNSKELYSPGTSKIGLQDDSTICFSLLQPLKPPPHQTLY